MKRYGSCNTVVSYRYSDKVKDILDRPRVGWFVTENDKIVSPYPWATEDIARVQAEATAQIRTGVFVTREEMDAARAKREAARLVAQC